jgi:hypothetical protein
MLKSGVVEKIATLGALVAAAACPACFPMLAVAGTVLGLGIFRRFEGGVFVVFQLLVLIALIGNILSFFRHRRVLPLVMGVAGPVLIFFALYAWFNRPLLYFGLFGLAVASVLNFIANRRCARWATKSMITCPGCGFAKEESMPTDACQFFYECTNCHAILKPKPGDCCVFCSYGSVKCPPKQSEKLAA